MSSLSRLESSCVHDPLSFTFLHRFYIPLKAPSLAYFVLYNQFNRLIGICLFHCQLHSVVTVLLYHATACLVDNMLYAAIGQLYEPKQERRNLYTQGQGAKDFDLGSRHSRLASLEIRILLKAYTGILQ
jgi:hypothetical protein